MYEIRRPIAFSERALWGAGGTYLTVLFIAGFLTNFLPIGPINTGTILLYSLAVLLSCIGILYLANPLKKAIALPIILVLMLSLLSIGKAMLDANPPSERVRELAILFLGAWPLLFFIQIGNSKIRTKLYTILARGLFGLSIFSIFQSAFASYLPLSLFTLRGDEAFGLHAVDTLRPTGLTGNPVIFSSIMVFASAYFISLWLETRKRKFFWALVISLVANYLTYTRASLVLVIPVMCCAWLLHRRFYVRHKIALLACTALAILGGQLLLVWAADSIAIQRLQNSNPEAIASTIEHFEQIQDARDAILAHPWLGTGIGSNSDFTPPGESIITDGAWWTMFLEFGAPLSILILISVCIVLVLLAKRVLQGELKDRALAIATLSFHVYLIPGNVINSAILGHISFGLYWAALGLSLADVA